MSETKADAEATIRSMILGAIAGTYGQSPEKTVNAVYEAVTDPAVRWALQILTQNALG